MPMKDIAGELERYYHTRIVIADSTLSQCSVTALYQDESLETVLESLALTLNLRITREEEAYVLSLVREPGS